jgi:nicotinamide riboside transporter PnuC
MYLTVRRAIEQWYVWAVVNALSFLMWLIIAIQGENVYSTVIMWGVYFILALYFYRMWKKELFDTKYFGDKIIQRECESQKRRGFYGV